MLGSGALNPIALAEKKTTALDVTMGPAVTAQRLKELRQLASMSQFEIDVSMRVWRISLSSSE